MEVEEVDVADTANCPIRVLKEAELLTGLD